MFRPFIIADSGQDELPLSSREMREDILNVPPTVLIAAHLLESNREVEGTGNACKGTSACNSHAPIMEA